MGTTETRHLPCQIAFFVLLFFWKVNLMVLIGCVWGPGVVYGDNIPEWVTEASSSTAFFSMVFGCVLTMGVVGSFSSGFVYRKPESRFN